MENNDVIITKNSKNGSLWRWIGIYLIVAVLAYGLVYYLKNRNGLTGSVMNVTATPSPTVGSTNTATITAISSSMAVSPSPQASPTTSTASSNNIFMSKTDAGGNYMTDTSGMTLYTYGRDSSGVSNCSGTCLQTWPPYPATAAPTILPPDISVIRRSDGTSQFAWKGLPLYYYVQDVKAGDKKGDGVAGVWHTIRL